MNAWEYLLVLAVLAIVMLIFDVVLLHREVRQLRRMAGTKRDARGRFVKP